jgi:hypothetical protein
MFWDLSRRCIFINESQRWFECLLLLGDKVTTALAKSEHIFSQMQSISDSSRPLMQAKDRLLLDLNFHHK